MSRFECCQCDRPFQGPVTHFDALETWPFSKRGEDPGMVPGSVRTVEVNLIRWGDGRLRCELCQPRGEPTTRTQAEVKNTLFAWKKQSRPLRRYLWSLAHQMRQEGEDARLCDKVRELSTYLGETCPSLDEAQRSLYWATEKQPWFYLDTEAAKAEGLDPSAAQLEQEDSNLATAITRQLVCDLMRDGIPAYVPHPSGQLDIEEQLEPIEEAQVEELWRQAKEEAEREPMAETHKRRARALLDAIPARLPLPWPPPLLGLSGTSRRILAEFVGQRSFFGPCVDSPLARCLDSATYSP